MTDSEAWNSGDLSDLFGDDSDNELPPPAMTPEWSPDSPSDLDYDPATPNWSPGTPSTPAHCESDFKSHSIAELSGSTSILLKKAPLEVRRLIYTYLLVNPLLSQTDAISCKNKSGATQRYSLSPAILQTCRQINMEASDVLYGSNTYIMSCIGELFRRKGNGTKATDDACVFESPLTRYSSSAKSIAQLASQSAFKNVRKWKLMISFSAGMAPGPITELQEFCRLLFSTQPKSVTILPLGKDFCGSWRGRDDHLFTGTSAEAFTVSTVLAPLKMLRNLWQLKFEGVGHEEIPYDDQLDAKIIAESDDASPLSRYPSLLAYAQAFERSPMFREAMGTVRWNCRADMATLQAPSGFLPQKRYMRKLMNPLKSSVTHPVEHSLELAKFACDENDINEFKAQREMILEYLEPQYQRITNLIGQLRTFVHKHKAQAPNGKHGILSLYATLRWDEDGSPDIESQIEDVIKGTILLEDCAKAFVRDVPPEIRRLVRMYQDCFDDQYNAWYREIPLRNMTKSYQDEDWGEWLYGFKVVAKDLEEQYVRIRHARERLFENEGGDEKDRGCSISLETSGCYREIVFWESKSAGDSRETAFIIDD